MWSLSLRFLHQTSVCISSLSVRATRPAHFILFVCITRKKHLVSSTNQKAPHYIPILLFSALLGPSIFLSTLFSNTSAYVLPLMWQTKFHTHTKQATWQFCLPVTGSTVNRAARTPQGALVEHQFNIIQLVAYRDTVRTVSRVWAPQHLLSPRQATLCQVVAMTGAQEVQWNCSRSLTSHRQIIVSPRRCHYANWFGTAESRVSLAAGRGKGGQTCLGRSKVEGGFLQRCGLHWQISVPSATLYWNSVKFYHHHRKHQGLDHLIRSVSKVTAALSNVSSVFQLLSFLVVCSGMIWKGLGFVAYFASDILTCPH